MAIIELRIPCDSDLLPMLYAGLPTRSIRLEEVGNGTHTLKVVGPRGPLADPFKGVEGIEGTVARYRDALERIRDGVLSGNEAAGVAAAALETS